MKLLAIRITNFRSFRETQTFTFPEQSGLYFMRGINEVEPRLEANGAGKSTIWDALTWCLFEKTPRGLKAGDVCNWEAEKGTKVEVDFYLDNDDRCLWTVSRTWKPNSWRLSHIADYVTDEEVVDLTKDKNNPVLDWLRLEFTPFLNCILTAQGQPMFLDQKADMQAALFSDVMGLDRWLEYSAIASKKASLQDSITRGLERKLSDLGGQLASMGKFDFKINLKDWEKLRQRDLIILETDYAGALTRNTDLKAKLLLLTEAERKARADWDDVKKPRSALEEELKIKADLLADIQTQLTITETEGKSAKKHLDHLEDNDHCPTCQQSLPKIEHQAQIKQARQNYARFTRAVGQITVGIKNGKLAVEDATEALDNQLKKEDRVRYSLDDTMNELAGTRRNLQLQERELDKLEEDAEKLLNAVNPFVLMHQQALSDGQRLQTELEDTQRLLDDSMSRYGLLSYWVKGFKELRLQLIAEALNELEIEVNSCVAALGLVDWELNFQVDRETKGGSVQRGFSVLVRSPHNRLSVPWAAWSGGEAQRLRLACNMGLADLIRSRSGVSLNLEVWDEPTAGLSHQGVQDLLEALATRARNENRTIFVVDHRTLGFGGFDKTCTVVKSADGSQVSWD